MYISVCEGSINGMRLGFCYIHQKLQFFFPLVDSFIDNLINKLLGAERSTEMRSALRGDHDLSVMEDILCFGQERILCCWPGLGSIGKITK